MAIFDELQDQANDMLIDFDVKSAGVFRYDPGEEGENDGFNKELKRTTSYIKNIRISIARGNTTNGSEYIGTTDDTDMQQNDVIEILDPRGHKRRWTVTGFLPTNKHTLLELDEVRDVA